MKKILLGLFLFFIAITPAFSKDKALAPNYIYDELLNAGNYQIVDYNYPAGSRELDLFNLKHIRQFNTNVVAAPDFEYLAYSEVYYYPNSRVTASALYLIQLDSGLSKKEAILSVSTKDKLKEPIIETNYAQLYPFKFNTYTVVDWDSSSNKILFKEKLGENHNMVYETRLYIYDLSQEKLFNLNIVRDKIIAYWKSRDVFLNDYKWDIAPLGFYKENENQVVVKAYGYHKDERKFLGTWIVDTLGKSAYLYTDNGDGVVGISSNGKCLKFIPDIEDVFSKQREIDAKNFETYIEPK